MNSTTLLKKLLVIERSIGTADHATLREMVYDAQDCLLQIQKARAESYLAEAWRDDLSRPELVRKAS